MMLIIIIMLPMLHDAVNCLADMLRAQTTHKLPHVFLSKQLVCHG
jgi:hypothetical protein